MLSSRPQPHSSLQMTLPNKDPEHLLKNADMINGGRGAGREEKQGLRKICKGDDEVCCPLSSDSSSLAQCTDFV